MPTAPTRGRGVPSTHVQHYQGHRPRVHRFTMPQRTGGSNTDSESVDGSLHEMLDNMREQKDDALHKAQSTEAANRQARQKTQELAEALIGAQQQVEQLTSTLEATQAALAERGLSLDGAYQRITTLEAQQRADNAAHRTAERDADGSRRDAEAAHARAAEVERQLDVLSAALQERTSEGSS